MKLDQLAFSKEVKEAKNRQAPIVALESTIISHGMPFPQNVETARAVEAMIRERGAVPATIAVLDGKIRVGLEEEELERLACADDVYKVSRRDLPYVVAEGRSGATTVAATMIVARWAGIDIFVTGGIGGVHREGQQTFDISADLTELARTNVAVVCAGAKSILDIGLTLEYLETQGVPVIGVGTDEFPSFFSRQSGFPVETQMDSPKRIARVIDTKWEMDLDGGVVIANPVPEEDAMDDEEIRKIIDEALQEANHRNITGKEVTPFLLDRVKSLTGGRSLQTNIALVKNNARVGADIAVALQAMR
ncbi:pseudouridine-5'-phosphate glycosidase [Desmospora profundinema]|uniref:Pseudouridine-5'-phosphate glycosidase n=1 Tax=Desmospora profundinema TaxID=1571184 RepID=A0ABU1IJZ4_9BACL|nr:pseudouridine-5'-phosphate glycosidase [Desmospora profundinema]MDR6225091.1 pseudouridine-5'-phosphate glycosidase [Desmospora profundinema]